MSAQFGDLFSDGGPTHVVEMQRVDDSDVQAVEMIPAPPDAEGIFSVPDGMCDLVAAIEQNTRTLEQNTRTLELVVERLNALGMIVQFMSDGTATMFGFFNSISTDLTTMSLGDKAKLITSMMKG